MLENGKLATLNIKDILPNRFQPRIHFDEQKLSELAESISKYGLIQPIVVRQIGSKYEIIAGERRYKASSLANKETIPAIIVTLSDRESEEIALLENIQREDLTPIEEAVSYKRILDAGYISQEELSSKIGKSQIAILTKMRLLNLDDVVQDALLHGKISERHARSLLKIKNNDKQVEMLNRIINERLTVKMTDKEISNLLEKEKDAIETLSTSDKPIRKAIPVASHRIIKVNPPKELMDKLNKKEEERVDTMDIDKILEEAQDIAPSEEQKPAVDMNSLMTQNPNTVTSPLITNEEPIVPTTEPSIEPGKFVTATASNEQPQTAPAIPNSTVSFDNIFNPNIGSLDSNNGMNSDNTVNNDQVVTNTISEPQLNNNIGSDASVNNGLPEMAPAIENSTDGAIQNAGTTTDQVVPQTFETTVNDQVLNNNVNEPGLMNNNINPINMENTANSLASEVNDEIANNNSAATWPTESVNENINTVDSMATPTVPMPENPTMDGANSGVMPINTNVVQPNIPTEIPAVTTEPIVMPAQTTVSPSITPTFETPSADATLNGGYVASDMMTQNTETTPLSDNTLSEPLATPTEQASPFVNPAPLGDSNLAEPSLVTEPATSTPIEPVQQTVPTALDNRQEGINETPQIPILPGIPGMPEQNVDTVSNINIPDDSIIEEAPNVQTPEQINTTLNDSANFRQVINIIRNCTSEIEKLGFYIDTDEVDLGDKYQVTFKINKQ